MNLARTRPSSTPGKFAAKRVFIVDDHPIVREGLVERIHRQPDLRVCGEAASTGQAISGINQTKPDLVLMDINLPGRSGLELIKDLRSAHPRLPVLVLSMHDENLYAERVLRAGGRGYVSKQAGGQKLIEAIRRVLRGQVYVSDAINAKILDGFAGQRREEEASLIAALTDRELEVFTLIGQGKESRQIARDLRMSLKTVETHRSSIKRKLRVKTAAELIRQAVLWVESSE